MRPRSHRSVSDIRWRNKTALVRADLNAPLAARNGVVQVADDSRLRAVAPTLQRVAQNGAVVVVLSHLGRPGGKRDPALSLAPVASALEKILGEKVAFPHSAARRPPPGTFHLMENARFHPGESENDPELAARFAAAAAADVFVMDAFACAHRAESSVCAVAKAAPETCVGLLVEKEIATLNRVMQGAKPPVVGVFGGAKISDKIPVIRNLAKQMDAVLVGGGAANTLLLAAGIPVGKSLAQRDNLQDARELLQTGIVQLPEDAVVADNPEAVDETENVSLVRDRDEVGARMILDIGEKTRKRFAEAIQSAGTVVWNGPMGAFETDAFAGGTAAVAEAVGASSAFSLAGGGDTLAAVAKFRVGRGVSHLSTGGGALLEYLSGRKLPGLVAVGAQ